MYNRKPESFLLDCALSGVMAPLYNDTAKTIEAPSALRGTGRCT